MENQDQQQKPPAEATPVMRFDQKDVDENKLIAALSYLGILCLIPLLAKKDSKYAQEHGKQGLVLFIAEIVGSIVAMIPILGWMLAPFIGLFFFVVAVIALIKCLMGEFWEVPLIGKYRHQFKI